MPKKQIDELFLRIFAAYGDKWLSLWVDADIDVVKRVWSEELADCSAEQIRLAYHALEGPFPPTLPEFRSLCRQFRPRTGAATVRLAELPPPKPAENPFAKLRAQLAAGKPVEG